MAQQLLSIAVTGRSKAWTFEFMGDPKHLAAWRADGLEVDEVVEIIEASDADLEAECLTAARGELPDVS